MNQQEAAEVTALQALAWIVSQPEELGAFLGATGASATDLAQSARDPRFLAALIDHILETDARVLACAADLGLPPTALAEARRGLPGGQDPHWT
jgi:hypothetical protein